MTTRSHSKSVAFSHSFELKGVDRTLAARIDIRHLDDFATAVTTRDREDLHCVVRVTNTAVEQTAFQTLGAARSSTGAGAARRHGAALPFT